MSEMVPTRSVPCPSCGGSVSTSGTAGESEWTICPHCKHEWACPPPRSVPEPRSGRWKRFARPALFLAGLLISTTGVASVFQAIEYPVPCPSCGGSAAGAAGATEWLTCPHCGYGWACRIPSLKSEPLSDEGKRWSVPSPATAERKSAYTMYVVCSVFWLGGAAVMVASREKVLSARSGGVGRRTRFRFLRSLWVTGFRRQTGHHGGHQKCVSGLVW